VESKCSGENRRTVINHIFRDRLGSDCSELHSVPFGILNRKRRKGERGGVDGLQTEPMIELIDAGCLRQKLRSKVPAMEGCKIRDEQLISGKSLRIH
jgi:hypothetical protein